jgi:cobalt-zinc-cadmium efflux system protein
LGFAVLVAGIIGSILTGSLALLADAGHMLTDSAGLLKPAHRDQESMPH